MRKTAVATVLFVMALFAMPLGAAATGGGSTDTPSCPLPTAPGAVVVDISDELMLAWDTAKSTAGPVPVSVPAGSWDVYLTSYDDHSNKTHQSQLEEQWYLEGWLAGSVVFTTDTTPDLPESTDVEWFSVGSITTTQAIDSVVAVHAAYPDSFEPHSVAPLCAAFYPTGTSPVAPPACPFPAGPGVVTISTELLLAWDEAASTAGPVAFGLAAGEWDVILVSHDNHSAKTHQAQTREQWYLEGWLGDALVFTTAATEDLREDTDFGVFAVGTIEARTAIDSVKAVHAAYPADEPHSVAPLCAVFQTPGDGGSSTTSSTTAPGTTSDTTTASLATTTTTGGGGDNGTTTSLATTTTIATTTTATTGGGDNGDDGDDGDDGDTTTSIATSTTTATTGGGDNGDEGDDNGATTSTPVTGQLDSGASTSVAAGLEGNTAQNLQQLPLTGVELETAFLAIVALMFGVVLLRQGRRWQDRLDRRAARVWRRQLS
ncbi:MAG: hypothetical protein HKM97_03495 [Acidimicrobiia bacterium]|nr:hypothetical protein [Acidimicrobiia bacterium]